MNLLRGGIAAALLIVTAAPVYSAEITTPIIYVQHTMPAVSLTVNGQKINKLALDTGAPSALYLTTDTLDKLLPGRAKDSQESGDIFGGQSTTAVIRSTTVTINGLTLSGVDAEEFQPWGYGMTGSNGQVLFNGVFGRGVVTPASAMLIDFQTDTLTITDNITPPAGYQWQTLPSARAAEGIIVTVKDKDQRPMRLMLDTGATHTVLFRADRGCEQPSPACPAEMITTPDGEPVTALVFRIPEGRTDIDGLLGMNYLRGHVLFISQDKVMTAK